MIFLPLPFVVALFLLTLLVQSLRRAAPGPARRVFAFLIAAYALQSVLVGLRWGYDMIAVLPAMPLLASLIAPMTYVMFASLTEDTPGPRLARLWPHLGPTALVVLLLAVHPDAIGPAIMATYLGYGGALLWLARRGPDALVASRLDGALRSYRALQITGLALIGSALTDLMISLDIARNGGAQAGMIVALADGLVLLVLGAAAALAGGDTPEREISSERGRDGPAVPAPDIPADLATTAKRIDTEMAARGLYRDPELNLSRLARRLRLPARQVSQAINRCHGESVSQYVNGHRVREACRLLTESDAPVGTVMFEAGFLTKSNFNREFLRVTGQSPSAWRQAKRGAAETLGGAPE